MDVETRYPRAGRYVDGLLVRDHVPNLSSIDGYFDESETLRGVRVVPMSDFGGPRSVFYAKDDFERSERLAEAIAESGEINPLIIGVDAEGPFIIEGAHRFVALSYLKKAAFPAVVVVDLESRSNPMKRDYYHYYGDRVKYRQQYGTVTGRAIFRGNSEYYPVRLDGHRTEDLLPAKHLTPVGARENPLSNLSNMELAFIVGGVGIVGFGIWYVVSSMKAASAATQAAILQQGVPATQPMGGIGAGGTEGGGGWIGPAAGSTGTTAGTTTGA